MRRILAQLRPGETVEATVREADGPGRVLLRILGSDVWAECGTSLTPGERVLLEVEAVAPVTVVRLRGGAGEARLRWSTPVVA